MTPNVANTVTLKIKKDKKEAMVSFVVVIKGECSAANGCTMCDDLLCKTCNKMTRICSECDSNASVVSTKCACDPGPFYYDSDKEECTKCDDLCTTCLGGTLFACTTCDATRNNVNNICLRGCPYGFLTSSCSTVSTAVINVDAVINADFDTNFMSTYGSFFRTGTGESTYQHFWNPETVDPIPAMNRGLYFSTMYLETTSTFWLSYTISLCMWVRIDSGNGGDLMGKGSFMRFRSNGVMSITIEDEDESTETLAFNSLTLTNNN